MTIPDQERFWTQVMALEKNLDSLSYYHLLSVERDATKETIESAYYRRIRAAHPDRHVSERDPERRTALARLYARFAEAFRVLRDSDLRRAYDEELAAGNARLSRDAEHKMRQQMAAPDPRTEHARKLLEKGRDLVEKGEVKAGLAQLRLAAKFEPDSKAIQAAIEAAEAETQSQEDGGVTPEPD
jgi:curved DNA-binding protein CbpA